MIVKINGMVHAMNGPGALFGDSNIATALTAKWAENHPLLFTLIKVTDLNEVSLIAIIVIGALHVIKKFMSRKLYEEGGERR